MRKIFRAVLGARQDFVCYGNTLTTIKRKLSREANKYWQVFDMAFVYLFDNPQYIFKLERINRIYPNNIIKRGSWK